MRLISPALIWKPNNLAETFSREPKSVCPWRRCCFPSIAGNGHVYSSVAVSSIACYILKTENSQTTTTKDQITQDVDTGLLSLSDTVGLVNSIQTLACNIAVITCILFLYVAKMESLGPVSYLEQINETSFMQLICRADNRFKLHGKGTSGSHNKPVSLVFGSKSGLTGHDSFFCVSVAVMSNNYLF